MTSLTRVRRSYEIPTSSGLARGNSVDPPALAARRGTARKTRRRPGPYAVVERPAAGRVVLFCIRFPPPIDAIPSSIQYFLQCGMTAGAHPDRGLMVSNLR